jgi:hypothetical protein
MMTIADKEIVAFSGALGATGRSPEIPEYADAYGWLVGSWDLDVLHYWAIDVRDRGLKCEAHFSWVREGRAVQDIWIMPPPSARTAQIDPTMNMYGTTLRVWEASLRSWRITWLNPVAGIREEQLGAWSGRDVVQLGSRPDGTKTRWSYTEITPRSFHWIGEAQSPDSQHWILEGEFRARRVI